jgi:hypothetical protein
MGTVNHTTMAGGVTCATCEWCEDVASYRVKVSLERVPEFMVLIKRFASSSIGCARLSTTTISW